MMDLYGVKTLIEDVEKAIENKEVKSSLTLKMTWVII